MELYLSLMIVDPLYWIQSLKRKQIKKRFVGGSAIEDLEATETRGSNHKV
jgi:hypothetical protein